MLIERAAVAQGPYAKADLDYEDGHVGAVFGPVPFNCVSAWLRASIGNDGRSLASFLGIGDTDPSDARRVMEQIEAEGNERVTALAVYGPRIRGFGWWPTRRLVRFSDEGWTRALKRFFGAA